jgi:hypothetical protein
MHSTVGLDQREVAELEAIAVFEGLLLLHHLPHEGTPHAPYA